MSQYGSIESSNESETITKDWGWNEPPEVVVEASKLSMKLSALQSGTALVTLGPITDLQLKTLLSNKPKSVLTLEWIAQNDPSLRPYIDKVLSLTTGYGYYDNLSCFTTHPAMSAAEVVTRSKELGAVLMMIEDKTPIIIFSSYSGMMDYVSSAREDLAHDVMRRYADVEYNDRLLVAVSRKDEVAAVLNKVQHSDPLLANTETMSLFDASLATNIFQQQLIDIIDGCLQNDVTDVSIVPDTTGAAKVMLRQHDHLRSEDMYTLKRDAYVSVYAFMAYKSGAYRSGESMTGPGVGQLLYQSSVGKAVLSLSFIPLSQRSDMGDLASINIRLTPQLKAIPSVDMVTSSTAMRDILKRASYYKQGLTVIAGPARSGKSTTLAAIVGANVEEFKESRKRVSIEYPVQLTLPSTTHAHIGNYDSTATVDAVKTHDCDLVIVGDIDHPKTLDCSTELAAAGHHVLTSLEAHNVMYALDKLLEMTPLNRRTTLIESLNCIVGQRLISTACTHCSTKGKPTISERAQFEAYAEKHGIETKLPDEVVHINHDGCDHCQHGYREVTPLIEVLTITPKERSSLYDMFEKPGARVNIQEAIKNAMFDTALELVKHHRIEVADALV